MERSHIRNILLDVFAPISRFGIPKPLAMPITLLAIYFTWLILINLLFSIPFPGPTNLFLIRDILLMIIFAPIYAHYSDKIMSLPEELVDYFQNPDLTIKVVRNSLSRIFDRRINFVVGLIYPIYYVYLTTKYLLSGYYAFSFYVYRLIAVVGLFIVGVVIYQIVMIIKMFVWDLKRLTPNEKAFSVGIPPLSEVAWMGSIFFLGMVSINLLPTFILGINPKSLIWYFTSHLLFYIISMIYFVATIFGVHRSMIVTKTYTIQILLDFISTNGVVKADKIQITPINSIKLSPDEAEKYLRFYKGAKVWPIRKDDVVKLLIIFIIFTIPFLIKVLI